MPLHLLLPFTPGPGDRTTIWVQECNVGGLLPTAEVPPHPLVTSASRAAWSPTKHILLGNMRPSNNPALDPRRANAISQTKISTIHFSQKKAWAFSTV